MDNKYLADLYRDLNRQVFSGMLPAIHVFFGREINSFALAHAVWNSDDGYVEIGPIEISTRYTYTEESIQEIMLHEMCHIAVYASGVRERPHGEKFQSFVRLVSEKRKKPVIVKAENLSSIPLVRNYKIPPELIFLIDFDDLYSIVRICRKDSFLLLKRNLDYILRVKDSLMRRFDGARRVRIGTCDSCVSLIYPKTSLTKLTTYDILGEHARFINSSFIEMEV